MANFVHLHVHSEYSLLDGLSKIDDLIEKCKQYNMPAMALTDHGALHGAIPFYLKAREAGIKPIIGAELYLARRSRFDKEGKPDKDPYHLLLLCQNYTGYQNLMQLITKAHLEGYYYKPRIDYQLLKEHAEGLIATSGCIQGIIPQMIIQGNLELAKKKSLELQKIFGAENFYFELQKHPNIAEQEIVNKNLLNLSREIGIPLIAANDTHYVEKDDAEAQEVLLCVQTQKNLADKNRQLTMINSPDFYLRSPAEMARDFADCPQALENTVRLAEKTDLEIPTGSWVLPNYSLPNGEKPGDYLKKICRQKLKELYGKNLTDEIKQRLDYELFIINKKGYATYFLIVSDFANWSKKQGIIFTTRGSAAGSLVSYLMGITTVNPLDYDLPFERFLTLDRPLPPDIDIDFADLRRDEVIDYVKQKYGRDHVAQIITFGKMEARQAIRDVGRVLGMPYSKPDRIAKLIPQGSQGFPMTIEKAIELTPELKELYQTDGEIKRLLDLAQKLEGVARHASIHAAGVVISPAPLTNYTPLQRESKGKNIITQYDMYALEPLGLLKMDFLGIRNLSILGRAIEIIEEEKNIKIDINNLPLDDRKAYQMLSKGETMGVFQLGGAGITRYLKKLKPNRIEDLAAMVALFRPGPMNSIPEYIKRKNNPQSITYLDPRMESILNKSYGVITYQDDVLLIAVNIAGYSWAEADKLRKAMGKKITREMRLQKNKFIKGCLKNNLSEAKATKLWQLIEPFAGYGFNKAHAAAYGLVAYQTAYIKAHFPVEYMTALLTAESQGSSGPQRDEKIRKAINECRKLKIPVLRPDINYSNFGFAVEKRNGRRAIRFGLSAIKNVGSAAIFSIITARKKGLFTNLVDFCKRIDLQKVNKKTIDSLTKAGAMDDFGSRAGMLTGLDNLITTAHRYQKERKSGQKSLFENLGIQAEENLHGFKIPRVEEFNKQELLQFERQFLGFYLSRHPQQELIENLVNYTTYQIEDILAQVNIKQKVKVGGLISSVRKTITKNGGNEMAFVRLEDLTGTLEVIVFPKLYQRTRNFWFNDQVVIVEAEVEAKEDRTSLIAQNAYHITEASDFSKLSPHTSSANIKETAYHINIPVNTSRQTLLDLKDLLSKNPGTDKLILTFNNKAGAKQVPIDFGVAIDSYLLKQIDSLLKLDFS